MKLICVKTTRAGPPSFDAAGPEKLVTRFVECTKNTEGFAESRASVCYDDQFLYAAFDLDEPFVSKLPRRELKPLQNVGQYDFVQLSIWAPEGRLFQIIVNCLGRSAILQNTVKVTREPAASGRKFFEWERPKKVPVQLKLGHVERMKDRWRATMKVPWQVLGKTGPRTDLRVLFGRQRFVKLSVSSCPKSEGFCSPHDFADLILDGLPKTRLKADVYWAVRHKPMPAPRRPAPGVWIRAKHKVIYQGAGMFPVVQKFSDGSIGIVLRAGAPHNGLNGRLEFLRSKDEGRTWSAPVIVSDGGPAEDHRNPSMGQMADGTLVVGYYEHGWQYKLNDIGSHYNTAYKARKLYPPMYFRLSCDMGRTWSPPSLIKGPCLMHCISPYGKIVVMPNGTAVMAAYGHGAFVLRSRDNGRTWGDLSLIAKGFNETGLLSLPSGKLLAAMRSERPAKAGEFRAIWITESGDDGYTWSTPRQVTRNAQIPGDLIRLESGEILLVHGNRFMPFGVRGKISRDEGRTWEPHESFALSWWASNVDCGYPSSTAISGDRILTAYYAAGTRHNLVPGIFCETLVYRRKDLPVYSCQ